MPSKFISAEVFIDKWIEAYEHDKGQRWIAEELGIAYSRVIGKAGYLRRYGIELPPLVYRKKRLNDESRIELNAAIRRRVEEINKQNEEPESPPPPATRTQP